MKILLLAALAMTLDVRAETIQCPARFPSKGVSIEGGRVQPARLSFAYLHSGDLYSEQLLQGPEPKHVQGGWDVQYGAMPMGDAWLVCLYGGTEWSGLDRIRAGKIEWWGKLNAEGADCTLKIREAKLPGSLSNWSAIASCKR